MIRPDELNLHTAHSSEPAGVIEQTVEASGPTVFVALASRLICDPFVGNNDLGRRVDPFEAYGNALRGPSLRLQIPGVDEAMGRFDELEYAGYPNIGAIWKSVGYSVGATHS
jgi:hypothetical protein